MKNALAKLDKATQMLAEAKSLDEVKHIMDIAEAARTYARAAKLGLEAYNHAAEVKARAERKAGEFLAQLERGTGKNKFNTMLNLSTPPSEYKEVLDDNGISYMAAHRWQQVAEMPEDVFEAHLEEMRGERPITTSGMIKELKAEKRQAEGVKVSKIKSPVNLYHGDMVDVLNTLGSFDLVVADPPYNVTGWDWDKLGSRDDFLKQTQGWLNAIIPHLSDKHNMFWFCSPSYAADIEILMRKMGLKINSRIVWHRRNMAKGSDAKYKFVDSWEMIFHVGNRELNFPPSWDDSRFDVQTFAVPQTNFNDTKYHPTQKPEELIRWLVSYGSFDGDKVLDPCAGSGTTAATCEGREYTLIEMEQEYVKVIEQRFGITANARI